MKIKIKQLAAAACALALLTGAGAAIRAAVKDEFTLTIVHTNDIHGHPDIYPYLKSYAAQVGLGIIM